MSQYAACRYRFSSQNHSGSSGGSGTGSSCGNGSTGSCSSGSSGSSSTGSGLDLPYPGFAPVVMRYLSQDSRPRSWCLMLITNPWFERISMLVILLNCVTLGMYQPCVDENCVTNRCKILQIFDDFIFAFFSLEMTIKMIAMGVHGRGTYLADSWNRLDFFIVLAGALEYCLHVENMNLSAIRTIRVLRPLRAINRIPSMRILVMLLLDTLPMLGNVLLLCFFVFFIFGIVGVQLWEGILRQRCVLQLPPHVNGPKDLPEEYTIRVRINSKEQEYICSRPEDSGMHHCAGLPHYRLGAQECNATALPYSHNLPTNTSCVDWHRYYTNCTQLGGNPFQGTISFDNIGLAWVAIFLVISLEGWTDIMYYVQDAHSFWDWIYFVLLIVIGSFFMINLCLVVIATQFSETKKREMARMRQERARFNSTSTLASSTNNSEPATCYAEIVKYVAHLYRRSKRRLLKKVRLYKYRRQQQKEQSLISKTGDLSTTTRHHHPHCPRYRQGFVNSQRSPLLGQSPNPIGMGSNPLAINPNQITQPTGVQQSPISLGYNPNAMGFNPSPIGALGLNPNDPSSPETSLTEQTPPLLLAGQAHVLLGPAGSVGSLRPALLRVPSATTMDGDNQSTGLLSPPPSITSRRRSGSSSVAFSDVVLLHHSAAPALGSSITPLSAPLVAQPAPNTERSSANVCSSEKTTQTGDGNIWQVTLPNQSSSGLQGSALSPTLECSELCLGEAAMTCQELLALSGALSAALPTGQIALDSFFNSLSKGVQKSEDPAGFPPTTQAMDLDLSSSLPEYPACCCDVQITTISGSRSGDQCQPRSIRIFCTIYRMLRKVCAHMRCYVKRLVEYKYFQQGILLAILINTLSMGIEYHNQPEELTVIVEYSNVVFSAIFAVEMMLKVIAEGPFGYVANGFNVFDGVIVVLSVIELCQTFLGERGGSSGLSVLRTFRLLRILKLVRFMPNLRRQLFVMLRTMDNVAVFFSLLVLFIFIFSVLGMYLFGGKFCRFTGDPGEGPREVTSKGEIVERECTCPEIVSRDPRCECDRKHFNDILWATVTVFQILTQEDWNVVLFNGMEKTSHWAALYFVALMTFGNYVLFNLLVAILVEGFSSERNERREREQRELAKSKLSAECYSDDGSFDESRTEDSSSDSFTQEIKNTWRSADELHKLKDANGVPNSKQLSHLSHKLDNKRARHAHTSNLKRQQEPKCNIEKQSKMLQRREPLSAIDTARSPLPVITHTAATPQDSPNTTLEPQSHVSGSVRGQALGLGDAALLDSLDFFDRSSSSSIPGLLKPPYNRASLSNTLKASCNNAVPSFEKSNNGKVSSNQSQNNGQVSSNTSPNLSKNGLNASNNGFNSIKNDPEKMNNMLSITTNELSASNNMLYASNNASGSNSALVSSNHSLNISNIGLNSSNNEFSSTSNGLNGNNGAMLQTNNDLLPCNNGSNNGVPQQINPNGSSPNGSQNSNINGLPWNHGSPQQNTAFSSTNNGTAGTMLNNNGQIDGHNISIAIPYCDKNTNMKENLNNGSTDKSGSALKIQRGYSWKLSRASLRRKNSKNTRSASETDAIVVLNNGRHRAQRRNVDLQSVHRIQNDTHGLLVTADQFNNNNRPVRPLLSPNPKQSANLGISPTPSFRGRSSTYGSIPQAGWALGLNLGPNFSTGISQFPNSSHFNSRKHSVSSVGSNNQKMHHRARRRSCAPEHFLTQISSEDLILARPKKSINSSSNILLANLAEQLELPKNISEENVPTCPSSNNNVVGINETQQLAPLSEVGERASKFKELVKYLEPTGCLKGRDDYSLYVFPTNNRFRLMCCWFVEQKWFDNLVLLFIAMNCITLAMERPNIPPNSPERLFLATANYIFTAVFAIEMFVKVVAAGMIYGEDAYFTSGWNIMDGSLVIISIIDLLMSLVSESSPRIFGILRVFRLLRSLRPLRVINRAPGLKLVVQTLLSSLRPIGNIVLICCTFFIIFGILGVQLFKGAFFYCEGENIKGVKNKTDCLAIEGNVWINRKYNFDDLGKALMSLFVLSSRDGWVNIMYTGLDAVGVDQQPIVNYSEWRLLYFIAFILLVGFFVLNMFVGVVVENFHRCREEQEKEERVRRAAKRALQMEKKRRLMHQPPYYIGYSPTRMLIHKLVTSKYFDLAIAAVIGLNVVTMATEYYKMPVALEYALKVFNYFFTAVFIIEAGMKLVALGLKIYMKDKWNQLDVGIVILSVVGIVLEELETNIIPINPTIIRVMRVLRIARVLKLLKMAKGIRALLDTVMQALPQVGNLGLLFFLLFFIFAALGVELFGRLECSDEKPCQGLGEHAHFANFGMAFLTLFRVATGDNWNGIMKDTLRDDCDDSADCVRNCCVSTVIAPIFFVIFVLMAQFVLVNVVVAVLMKHLEESHKQMEDEQNMETELEREMEREMEDVEDKALCKKLEENVDNGESRVVKRSLTKVLSLPKNYTYSPQVLKQPSVPSLVSRRRMSMMPTSRNFRRQTFHSHQALGLPMASKNASLMLEMSTSTPRNNWLLETPRNVARRNPSLAETSRTFSLLETSRRPSTLETCRNPSLREISRAASLAETCRRQKYSTETDPDEVLYEEDVIDDDLEERVRKRSIVLKLNQDASGIVRKRLEKARSYEEPSMRNEHQTQTVAEMQLFRENYVGDFLTVPSTSSSTFGRRQQMLQRQVSISSHCQDQLIEEQVQESSLLLPEVDKLSEQNTTIHPKHKGQEQEGEEFQESVLLLPEVNQEKLSPSNVSQELTSNLLEINSQLDNGESQRPAVTTDVLVINVAQDLSNDNYKSDDAA